MVNSVEWKGSWKWGDLYSEQPKERNMKETGGGRSEEIVYNGIINKRFSIQ